MPISLACHQCGSQFQVKEEFGGKRGKCPRCQTVLQIPVARECGAAPAVEATLARHAAAAVAPAIQSAPQLAPAGAASAPVARHRIAQPFNQAEFDQQVLNGFQGPIAPVRISLMYRFGILLVSGVMLLLPLIYLAVIGLVCYTVYYHAVHHAGIVTAVRGRGVILALLVYLAPMAIGALLILFMFKPLFAPPPRDRRTRSLTRDGEPLLFAFVDRLCETVRAPQPQRIDVDCEINAHASFRRGFRSMLVGNDLVLTIGMPLVAGLSVRQFAGVLAHEFGHFSQGAGMRLTYVVRTINMWFTRVVYQRDALDEWLVTASQEFDMRVAWVLMLTRLCVWLTRRLLWLLMIVGHAVSGFLMRQMEFDADRHETRVAGSAVFESTVRRLLELQFAHRWAQEDLQSFYREGRLGDNLPKLIMANIQQLPPELAAKIDELIEKADTGWFDTHPADKERIASSHAEHDPGIYHFDDSAHVLFRHYEALSKNVTWDFYRDIFGAEFQPQQMHSTDDLLQRQKKEMEAGQAMGRYFQGGVKAWRFVRLPSGYLAPPADARKSAAAMKQARENMLAISRTYGATYDNFEAADERYVEATLADAILGAFVEVEASDFKTPLTSSSQVARAKQAAGLERQRLAGELEAFESAAGQRLFLALELLEVPQITQRVDNAAQHIQQCRQMFPVLQAVCAHAREALALRQAQAELAVLCGKIDKNRDSPGLMRKISDQIDRVYAALADLRQPLSTVMYPYDHARGAMTVNIYLLRDMPVPNDLGALFSAAEQVLEKYVSLYLRLLGSLALIAEKVETAFGLPQLAEPVK